MKSFSTIILLSLCAASSTLASVLNTTNIATVLDGVEDQSVLTIPVAARTAISKLGTGGVNAASLSAADKAAISSCATTAQNNNAATRAGITDTLGSAGNIAFVVNKISIHACESAGQQISVAAGGAASDTDISTLIENVGVLNVNTNAAAGSSRKKREVVFKA